MFRVLSDEESKKVTRWRAPEVGDADVINTPQNARPESNLAGDNIRALLGSLELKPGHLQSQTAAPSLQSVSARNVYGSNSDTSPAAQGNPLVEMSSVSADLLQSSYDEGYAKGFAEGNAALQQHAVKELRAIIPELKKACELRLDTDLEHEVIALALDIARLVMRREVTVDETVMQNIVTAGLQQLPGGADFPASVYLHPLDANTVRDHLQNDTELRVLDDTSLDRGACRIESGSSTVNSGIEDWLALASVQLGLTQERDAAICKDSAEVSERYDPSVETASG